MKEVYDKDYGWDDEDKMSELREKASRFKQNFRSINSENYTGNRNQIRNYASLYSIYKSYIILKSTV